MSRTKQIPAKKLTEYFSKNKDTNIMISDSQLTEKSPFDLFNRTNNFMPAVFINRNDNEMENAIGINHQNIISKSENNNNSEMKILNAGIVQSLLKDSFYNKETDIFLRSEKRKKTRLLVKRGVAYVSLLLNNIALIYTKDKSVYVIDHDSKKYSADKTLTELEEELDNSIFFRANRQYIVNLNFIKSFKAYQKVKLLLDVNVAELEEPIIISQQVAPVFKKWMNDA